MKNAHLRLSFGTLILAGALLCSAGVTGQEGRPPWLTEEVLAAGAAIQLTEVQAAPFRENVSQFLQSYGEEVRRLIRRNEPDLQIHIDRKRESLARKMDAGMEKVLSEEQMAPYQDYRRALLAALDQI